VVEKRKNKMSNFDYKKYLAENKLATNEVYSEKQRRWACAQDGDVFDEMCKDTAISKKKKIKEEEKEEGNRVPSAELILPRGKKVVLQAEDQDYKRGLIVELLDDGGYEMAYWYDKPDKPYPVEILVDGVSIKEDGKIVEMKFHPQDYYDEQDKLNEDELSKKEVKSLKKISKQLKKSVKSHKDQAKTIDKIVKE
tara:strand:+ start:574 stop:1158 length:585 start_codon:yes stop_codon:yes gene_type:complete